MTGLERIIQRKVAIENGVKSIADIGYGAGYSEALVYMERFLNGLTMLRDKKGITIIAIAHDQIKRYEDPMGEGYDRHTIKLHTKAGAKALEWADAVLFGREKTYTRTEDGGFNKKVTKAIGGGNVLYTKGTPAFDAKHRASLSLPDEIPLSWDAFISSVGKRETK